MFSNIVRYIGSKTNLHYFLNDIIISQNKDKRIFIDLFAGTNSVSKLVFKNTDMDIVSNDISKYSNFLFEEIVIKNLKDKKLSTKINKILENIDKIEIIENGIFFNEFSINGKPKTITDIDIFHNQPVNSRMFFPEIVGKKIDTVRYFIKNNDLNEIEKNIIILFLLNYANKNSNTTSIYGAYLKHDKIKKIKDFYDKDLFNNLFKFDEKKEKIKLYYYKGLAENSLKEIKKDLSQHYKKEEIIIYIDPPYNTRAYETNYHILEYLCDMNFDISMLKIDSKTALPKKVIDNPFRSKVKTLNYFKEILKESIEISNTIYVSYNDEGLIKLEDMENIAKDLNLTLNVFEENYKRFTSGENNKINNGAKNKVKEYIWELKTM